MYSDQMILAEFWNGGDTGVGIWDGGSEPTTVLPTQFIYYDSLLARRNIGISADRSEFFQVDTVGVRRRSLVDGALTTAAKTGLIPNANSLTSAIHPLDGRVFIGGGALGAETQSWLFDPADGSFTAVPVRGYSAEHAVFSQDGSRLYLSTSYRPSQGFNPLWVYNTADWSYVTINAGALAGMSTPSSSYTSRSLPSPDGELLAVAVHDGVSQSKVVALRTSDWTLASTVAAFAITNEDHRPAGWSFDSQTLIVETYGTAGNRSPMWYTRNGDDTFTKSGELVGSPYARARTPVGGARTAAVSDYNVPVGGFAGVRVYDLDTAGVELTLARSGNTAALDGTVIFTPSCPLIGPAPAQPPFWTNFKRTTEVA